MNNVELPEYVLLAFLLIYSIGMFIQSYSFSYGAAIFPRFTSAMIIVGVVSLLTFSFSSHSNKEEVFDVFDPDTQVETERSDSIFPPYHEVLILTALFVLIGYLVGLLWAAPIFTFVYLSLADKSFKKRFIISALVGGIALLFMLILDAPIESGVIQAWL